VLFFKDRTTSRPGPDEHNFPIEFYRFLFAFVNREIQQLYGALRAEKQKGRIASALI
jgi:hypothetical protein